MIKDIVIKNIDIGVKDVDKAVEIYGKPVPTLKGHMTRATPVNHDGIESMDLVDNIKGKEINLYTDVLKTTKCNFLMTKSGKGINFTQAQYLKTMNLDSIQHYLLDQKEVYIKQGFKVVKLHADGEFNRPSLEHDLLSTT